MLRCVWILNCCWFHQGWCAVKCIYFLAWIGGSWSLTVMESRRMLGLSYSSILMPAWRRLQRVKKKERRGERREIPHSSPCSMPVLSDDSTSTGLSRDLRSRVFSHAAPTLESPEHQCAFPWLTSRQSTRFTVRTATRSGKCALAIDARHHDRCQQTLALAEQQQGLRNLCWGIGKHVTGPFDLQHRDLFLVGVTMQLLDDTCVRRKHTSYQQNVYFAVLQWQVFATEKKKIAKLFTRKEVLVVNDSRHKRLHVVLDIFAVEGAMQATLKVGDDFLLIGVLADQLLTVIIVQ